MRTSALISVLLAAAIAAPAEAQAPPGGTITGVVRDSSSQPVAAVEIVVRPGQRAARTDSTGRFTVAGLDAGKYSLRTRKLGFAAAKWDVEVSKTSGVNLTIVLDRRPALLDTITVVGKRECAQMNIEAFLCRRHRGGGLFLDYTDIDDKEVTYTGELFRDIPGFRVEFRGSPTGPAYAVTTSKSFGCINSLVDGRPTSGAIRIPELASSLIAMEIYTRPDSIPPELARYLWPKGNLAASGRCIVIVYWTDGRVHGSFNGLRPD